MLSVQQVAGCIPSADAALLRRRVQYWSDTGILKPEEGVRSRRTNRKLEHRRYAVEEVYYCAMALELMDAGLNPILLPKAAEFIRGAIRTDPEFRALWQQAKAGDQEIFMIATCKWLDDDNMEIGVVLRPDESDQRVERLLQETRKTPSPHGMIISLTRAFSHVRVPA